MKPGGREIILASGSKARQDMLRGCGIAARAIPADIDEAGALREAQEKGYAPVKFAGILAIMKAEKIALQNQGALVIGSDQVLEQNGTVFSKAKTIPEAREKLLALRGRSHTLHSAVSVAQNEKILWSHTASAVLHMHDFGNEFLDRYLDSAGDTVTACVGAYALEGLGAQLFDVIEGDYFTILGMPLLPLLKYLREEQGVSL